MKFKKALSLLLSALMVTGSAAFSANAAPAPDETGAYSNQNYLETQASAAYNEKDLGSTYSKASTRLSCKQQAPIPKREQRCWASTQ